MTVFCLLHHAMKLLVAPLSGCHDHVFICHATRVDGTCLFGRKLGGVSNSSFLASVLVTKLAGWCLIFSGTWVP